MVPRLHNHLLDLPPVIALCYDKLIHLQDARPVALLRSVGCKDAIGANKRLACSMDKIKALHGPGREATGMGYHVKTVLL